MSIFGRVATSVAVAVAVGAGMTSVAHAAPGPQVAKHEASVGSGAITASQVCTVVASDATIRQSPGGAVLATTYYGDRFRVDNFRDNIWVFGAGYRPNGTLIAYGYILRNTLSC